MPEKLYIIAGSLEYLRRNNGGGTGLVGRQLGARELIVLCSDLRGEFDLKLDLSVSPSSRDEAPKWAALLGFELVDDKAVIDYEYPDYLLVLHMGGGVLQSLEATPGLDIVVIVHDWPDKNEPETWTRRYATPLAHSNYEVKHEVMRAIESY